MTAATAKPAVRVKYWKQRPTLSGQGGPVRLQAEYDAAQTTGQNKGHWGGADALSARAANSPGVRRILRNRARYEVANNAYALGILETHADHVIGTGPKLQVLTSDERFNTAVEQRFAEWADATNLADKLWQMRFGWGMDGESFALMFANLSLDHPVKLDLQTHEPDQISDNGHFSLRVNPLDGVVVDDFGNIVAYRILPQHPGDLGFTTARSDPETHRADRVIHLMQSNRAGTFRAVSQLAPALMLYPTMRRFTYATLHAAETAAKISGVLRTQQTAEDPDAVAPLDPVDLGGNEWLTLPMGWDLSQFQAQHPNGEYKSFKREVIAEAARSLGMPYNLAAADSSEHNFSSGKLDKGGYGKRVLREQDMVRRRALEPILRNWFEEARRIDGLLPPAPADARESLPHKWTWDGEELLDPREANSQVVALSHGLDALTRLHGKRGLDTQEVLRSNAQALGMTLEEYQQALRDKLFGPPASAGPPMQQDGA